MLGISTSLSAELIFFPISITVNLKASIRGEIWQRIKNTVLNPLAYP